MTTTTSSCGAAIISEYGLVDLLLLILALAPIILTEVSTHTTGHGRGMFANLLESIKSVLVVAPRFSMVAHAIFPLSTPI